MELMWDHIRPFLSERGALEVEMAALRAQIAIQNTELEALRAAAEPDNGTS